VLGDSRQEEARLGVIIIREMVGTSPRSWSDAARRAVATASRTVRNIRTIEVVKSTARVEDGEIVEYLVELKLGFEYEGPTE
jgi:dodecin